MAEKVSLSDIKNKPSKFCRKDEALEKTLANFRAVLNMPDDILIDLYVFSVDSIWARNNPKLQKYRGGFARVNRSNRLKAHQIIIWSNTADPEVALAHELGHIVHCEVCPEIRQYWNKVDRIFLQCFADYVAMLLVGRERVYACLRRCLAEAEGNNDEEGVEYYLSRLSKTKSDHSMPPFVTTLTPWKSR